MVKYIAKRTILALLTMLLIITITFFLMHSIPGSPWQGDRVLLPEIEAALNEKYNLDLPVWQQYLLYLKGLLVGDLGISVKYRGMTVWDLISQGFPISARLGMLGAIAVAVLGVPLGIYAAIKQNKWQDRIIISVCTVGAVIPSFVMAILCTYIFSVKLGWLPVFGLNNWQSYILPVSMIAVSSVVGTARITRTSMLDVISQDYVRMARAKGLSEFRVVMVHVLRNALIPVVTSLGMMFQAMLTGSFVIERMFAIPGMGRFFVDTINNRDYMCILGMAVLTAAIMIVTVLIIDILYTLLDPRIRLDQ